MTNYNKIHALLHGPILPPFFIHRAKEALIWSIACCHPVCYVMLLTAGLTAPPASTATWQITTWVVLLDAWHLTISSASLCTSHNPSVNQSHQKVDVLTQRIFLYDLFHIQYVVCLLRGTNRNFTLDTNPTLSGRAMAWRLVSVLSAGSASLCSGGQEEQGQVLLSVSVFLSALVSRYKFCSP